MTWEEQVVYWLEKLSDNSDQMVLALAGIVGGLSMLVGALACLVAIGCGVIVYLSWGFWSRG